MIFLKPSKSAKTKHPTVDFETLSNVFSVVFDSVYKVKKKRNYTINIRISKRNDSYYMFQAGRTVWINISHLIVTERMFISTLLHEFRHFIQDRVYKVPLTKANYDDTCFKSYHASPIEVDARTFEITMLPYVLRLYNRLKKQKELFSTISVYKGTNNAHQS